MVSTVIRDVKAGGRGRQRIRSVPEGPRNGTRLGLPVVGVGGSTGLLALILVLLAAGLLDGGAVLDALVVRLELEMGVGGALEVVLPSFAKGGLLAG